MKKTKIEQLNEQAEDLRDQADLTDKSVKFWEKEALKIIAEIDNPKLESWDPKYNDYIEGLLSKLYKVKAKAAIERDGVEKLEKNTVTFLEAVIKSKKKKK